MRSILVLRDADVAAARAFWQQLGFDFEEFSGDDSACLVVADDVFVMLLRRDRFAEFVVGPVADAHAATGVLLCLSAAGREEVDDLVARAVAAGGKPWRPAAEQGPAYGGSFQDPDGHVRELVALPAA